MTSAESKLLVDPDGQPLDRIHGVETEYGAYLKHPSLESYQLDFLLGRLLGRAIPGANANSFDNDQNRVYTDVGSHPELSTAEDLSFSGTALRVVIGHIKMARRLQRAYDYILSGRANTASDADWLRGCAVFLLANTCDASQQTSWSSHENRLLKSAVEIDDYAQAMIAHRTTRIVWSGAGKPRKEGERGFAYELSEKASFISALCGPSTTSNRALINTRDEPLADKELYRRDHDITGESVFSPRTNGLRHASTSIIMRACELGESFDDLCPEAPLEAIRDISEDPALRKKVRTNDGRWLTAIEIQRELAERSTQAAFNNGYLTEQEKVWAVYWLDILDQLEKDPMTTKLDWVYKLKAIDRELSKPRSNGDSDFEAAWNKAIQYHLLMPEEGLGMRLLRRGMFDDCPPEQVLENGIPLPDTRARLRAEVLADLRLKYPGVEGIVANSWSEIVARNGFDHTQSVIMRLPDPYLSSDDRAKERFLKQVSEHLGKTVATQV